MSSHTSKFLWVLWMLAAALTPGCMAADKEPEVVELKIYDVSDLTASINDYPGPDVSVGGQAPVSPKPDAAAPHTTTPATPTTPTAASLADIIKTRVHPESWDAALGTSIEEMGGQLVVMQKPGIHAQIQELLKTFAERLKTQVVVRAMLVPSATIPDATIFDADSLAKTLGGNPAAEAVAAPQVLCYNKQRVFVMSGSDHNYVAGADVNDDMYDPVVQQIFTGVVMDVRPVLSDDRKSLDVEFRLTLNDNLKINTRFVGAGGHPVLQAMAPLPQAETSATTPKKTEPGKDGDETTANAGKTANPLLNARYLVGFELDAVTVDSGAIRTAATAPIGKWMLVGTLANPDAKSPKKQLLCFVMGELVK